MKKINELLSSLIASSRAETSPCFLHEILFRLKYIEESKTETMGIDQKGNLFYNLDFVNELSKEELYGCLLHEAMHIAFFHPERSKNKDHLKWNYVTDLIINNILVNNNITLPSGIAYKRLEYNITEEILYDKIQLSKNINNHGFWGHSETSVNQINKNIISEVKEKFKNQHYEKISNIDKFIIKQCENFSTIDWLSALKDFLSPLSQNYKYNFAKRSVISEMMYQQRPHESTFLPKLENYNKDDNLIIVIDTSGSTSEVIHFFYKEIVNLINEFNITAKVILCDSEITDVFDVSKETLNEKKLLSGGGGTSFNPPFEYIEKNKIETSGLIYFTDGLGICNHPEPDYPVLWISTYKLNFCNFGNKIKMHIN